MYEDVPIIDATVVIHQGSSCCLRFISWALTPVSQEKGRLQVTSTGALVVTEDQ